MPNPLYSDNEKLGKTTEEGSDQSAGSYTACFGKTYNSTTRGGKDRIVTDFFLVNHSETPESDTEDIMRIKMVDNKQTLEFLKDKSGKPKTYGVLFRNSFMKDATGFVAGLKIRFAKACGAYDKENNTINWLAVQELAGAVCSFNVAERNGYLNMDVRSLQIYPGQRVAPDNIASLYATLEAEAQAREAKKHAQEPDFTPPPDVERAEQTKDDDEPF